MWSIERRNFQWPWTTPTPSFMVTPFFDAEYLRNGTTYRHSFNEVLIGTYTRPTQQCHFEWTWVILSDLAKYSITWSVACSLCDSWASCFYISWTSDNVYQTSLTKTHCESKKLDPFSFEHTFRKYCPIFTARRVCITRTMPWQDVCLSVCLSYAGIESKRLYISSKFFSPSNNPTILVFPHQTG